ncbi:hypothetical protein Bca4012_059018 [Brassica carinata]
MEEEEEVPGHHDDESKQIRMEIVALPQLQKEEEEEEEVPGYHDDGGKQISMERVEIPQLHTHPLIPFNRFVLSECEVCSSYYDDGYYFSYMYGGYRCNELGCQSVVFHKDCATPLKKINHSFHPDHPLKLITSTYPLQFFKRHKCFCGNSFKIGYCCSICDFKLCLKCARRSNPLVYRHEHPLKRSRPHRELGWKFCRACKIMVKPDVPQYRCQECKGFVIHRDCLDFFPEAYHTSHPLKSLGGEVPDYADKKCLLCERDFDEENHQLHHCDVCNLSICRACMRNPPPVDVECLKTHEHQLHLVLRLIDFTCNACGTKVVLDMESGNAEFAVNKVDGFYGAYTCSKCPTFSVHARCATNERVWDMVEQEGTPEEEEIAPYEVIDDNTIRHFSHDHDLQFNKDGMVLSERTLCKACVFQIGAEPFYICKQQQCDFILHKKCANLPRRKRHVANNLPFTLHTDFHFTFNCWLCGQHFTGFRYQARTGVILDVRCASISDSIEHESHPHPLYFYFSFFPKECSRCKGYNGFFSCDECDYSLGGKCARLPEKVMRKRYDDHPLFLSYGDMNVDEIYWCEACETKVDPEKGFYTCNDCGVVLHISCLFGDFSGIMPGSFRSIYPGNGEFTFIRRGVSRTISNEEVVSNNSICRLLCAACNSRCKHPSVLKSMLIAGSSI